MTKAKVKKFLMVVLLIVFVLPEMLYAQANSTEEKPLTKKNLWDSMLQQEYEASKDTLLPLEEDMIKDYQKKLYDTLGTSQGADHSVEMKTKTVRLVLEPGSKPFQVNLYPGYTTSLAFFDSIGSPWELTSYTVGNPKYFFVVNNENSQNDNILNIAPLVRNAHSNISLTLKGHDMPIIVGLRVRDEFKSKDMDSMVVFKANKLNSKSYDKIKKENIAQNKESSTFPYMMNFLNFTPPADSVDIGFEADQNFDVFDFKIWEYQNSYFVRTTRSLVWPAFEGILHGPEDIRVYRFQKSPALILSDGSNKINVKILE
jgi:intracellular multiplication protein IcmK